VVSLRTLARSRSGNNRGGARSSGTTSGVCRDGDASMVRVRVATTLYERIADHRHTDLLAVGGRTSGRATRARGRPSRRSGHPPLAKLVAAA